MRFIFFSLRDFNTDVGESVRMYGLLNSLAEIGNEVIFISNAGNYRMFHPSIKHKKLGGNVNSKRMFQGMLALLPARVVYLIFGKTLKKINKAFKQINPGNEPVYFFDYLDNSVGHVLKKQKIITSYINDVHGIATIEFENHIKNAGSIWNKAMSRIKYLLAYRLDRKVFEGAGGFIFGSGNMKKYYESNYLIEEKPAVIIPYLLGNDAIDRKVNFSLKNELIESLKISDNEFVILFVGTYKPTSGVDDLIKAFVRLDHEFKNVKLILIGGGPLKRDCVRLAAEADLNNKIIFIDNIAYADLLTYQSIAKVIVCPDKDNLYSHFVVHVKYYDALLSGKLVINGSFKSVQEINPEDSISLTFKPSDTDDLYSKLKDCIINYAVLSERYKEVRAYTAANLTYSSYINRLIEWRSINNF